MRESVPKWNREAGVVVIGFVGAGAATAITAHDLGATALPLQKAPEAEEGGNTPIRDSTTQAS